MALSEEVIVGYPRDWSWLYTILMLCFIYIILVRPLYRAFIHPLSKYPGPRLWAMTKIPYDIHMIRGDLLYKVAKLHEKYGAVVRLTPNELSYITEDAWNDIYTKQAGVGMLEKNLVAVTQYPPKGIHGILTTRSEEDHARMRRNFSSAFSDKALRELEPILTQYFDLLIKRLHEHCVKPVNFVYWYNFTTFDLISDLTFGESFGCLEKSKIHPFVEMIFGYIKARVIVLVMRRFAPLDKLLVWMAPKTTKDLKLFTHNLIRNNVDKRLASDDPRLDFMSYAREHLNTPKGMNIYELRESASVLLVAGSESTAALLSGATYHLLKNPVSYRKLVLEIRSTFESEDQITLTGTSSLKYLLAVLDEALRIFPPGPSGQQRRVPPQGHSIAGRFVPGNTIVYVHHWSAYTSPTNFRDPEKFVPERWLGDPKYADDRRDVVHPFSVGPRNCMGMNLAYVEMRIILARILWNFDLELCEQSKEWAEKLRVYLIWAKEPLMVKLTPVKRG